MLVAVLFLLLGVWSAELALFDVPFAPVAGAGCLVVCAAILAGIAVRTRAPDIVVAAGRERPHPPISARNYPQTPQKSLGSTPFSGRSATFGR